jgi:hypothetical protein
MIISAPDEISTAVTIFFHKPLSEWTAEDRNAIIRRLREFMRKRSGEPKKKRAKRRQIDIEELIDAKNGR